MYHLTLNHRSNLVKSIQHCVQVPRENSGCRCFIWGSCGLVLTCGVTLTFSWALRHFNMFLFLMMMLSLFSPWKCVVCVSVERRRRFNINDRIKELGALVPKPTDLSVNAPLLIILLMNPITFTEYSWDYYSQIIPEIIITVWSGRWSGTKEPSWRRRWITSGKCRKSNRELERWRRDRGGWRAPTAPCCSAYRWGGGAGELGLQGQEEFVEGNQVCLFLCL